MITEMTNYHDLDTKKIKLELTAELKPCPFCGGHAEARYSPGAYGVTGVKVICTKCKIATLTKLIGCGAFRDGHFEAVTEAEAFDEAVSNWNRRTTA